MASSFGSNATTGVPEIKHGTNIVVSADSATGKATFPTGVVQATGAGMPVVWEQAQELMPSGSIIYLARNTAPTGWLKANGAAISRTTYASLFSAIGTTFGAGDGSTTFNLPDLRGEFIRGWDNDRGVDMSRVFGSAQEDLLKNHKHTIRGGDYFAARAGFDAAIDWYSQISNANDASYYGMDVSGGGAETRPRNIALLACIKY